MYRPINGFTVASIKETIRAKNNGKRAYGDEACRYLTDDGNRCAVGCFIPDGHAGQMFLGYASQLLAKFPDLTACMPLPNYALGSLQTVHDCHVGDGDVRDALCAWIDAHVTDEPAEVSP